MDENFLKLTKYIQTQIQEVLQSPNRSMKVQVTDVRRAMKRWWRNHRGEEPSPIHLHWEDIATIMNQYVCLELYRQQKCISRKKANKEISRQTKSENLSPADAH